MQRKYKTVQKLEGATQKSLDEEIKSADNIPIESTSQKLKIGDEDSAQPRPDAPPSSNSTSIKKDSKLHGIEDVKEKSHLIGTGASKMQNEQSISIQEKDTVDSVEATVVTPQLKEIEDVIPNDKANGM